MSTLGDPQVPSEPQGYLRERGQPLHLPQEDPQHPPSKAGDSQGGAQRGSGQREPGHGGRSQGPGLSGGKSAGEWAEGPPHTRRAGWAGSLGSRRSGRPQGQRGPRGCLGAGGTLGLWVWSGRARRAGQGGTPMCPRGRCGRAGGGTLATPHPPCGGVSPNGSAHRPRAGTSQALWTPGWERARPAGHVRKQLPGRSAAVQDTGSPGEQLPWAHPAALQAPRTN